MSPKRWRCCRHGHPSRRRRCAKAWQDGLHLLLLDGTLIATDRPYCSAKHCCHGMSIRVIAGPDGTIVWTLGRCPAAPTI